MTALLEIRERLKAIYSEYSKWIDATLRFVFAFLTMTVVNSRMGYVGAADSVLAMVALSLLCAVLPVGMSFVAAYVFIILNLLKISVLMAGAVAGMGVLMYLLYFSFKPGNAYAATLGLMLGLWGCFAPVAMIIALLASPITLLPALFGIVVSAFVAYVDTNYGVLVSPDHASDGLRQLLMVLKGVATDEALWITCLMVCLITVVIFFIRRIFFKNNWLVAIFSGSVLYLILSLILSYERGMDASALLILVNVFLAIISGLVLHFFNFMVDASRVEHVQFEDDDYYYYVKVVPKVRVTTPEVRVTKINSRKVRDEVKTSEQVTFLEDVQAASDEDLEEEFLIKTSEEPEEAPEEIVGGETKMNVSVKTSMREEE